MGNNIISATNIMHYIVKKKFFVKKLLFCPADHAELVFSFLFLVFRSIRGRLRILRILRIFSYPHSCNWLRPLSSRLGKDIKRACVSALAAPIIRVRLRKSARSARSA